MNEKPWTYSHTQVALWRLCKRRYYYKYVLNKTEATTPNMAAGTWLCQNPIEDYVGGLTTIIESYWPNFLAEFGGDEGFDSPIFNKNLPGRILDAYKKNPVKGNIVEIEKRFFRNILELPYQSIPDLVVDRDGVRITWDIKLKTFNQNRANDTFFATASLSSFDDQCLGQAILADAQVFGQIVFLLGKYDGTLIGPIYLEHPVSAILKAEWLRETGIEINEIDEWRIVNTFFKTSWPKNDASCRAFGKPCPRLVDCGFGFEAVKP